MDALTQAMMQQRGGAAPYNQAGVSNYPYQAGGAPDNPQRAQMARMVQMIMQKAQSGVPLSPQEEAILSSMMQGGAGGGAPNIPQGMPR